MNLSGSPFVVTSLCHFEWMLAFLCVRWMTDTFTEQTKTDRCPWYACMDPGMVERRVNQYMYIDIVFSHFCWKLPLYFGSKVVTPCAKESLRKDQLLPALQHVRDGSKWPPHLGSKAVNVWNSKLED